MSNTPPNAADKGTVTGAPLVCTPANVTVPSVIMNVAGPPDPGAIVQLVISMCR